MLPIEYEPLLARVEKPGRYVGGELNAVLKDPARLRASIALAFPDVYDLGMSYHGFRILYEAINAREDFAAERVFTPWPDFADALRGAGLPLRTLETARRLDELEIVGFTLQHELCYTNVLETLDLAGIPLRSADRTAPFPLVVAGGEGAWSPEPMADFVDAFVLGDGEQVILELLEVAAQGRDGAWDRPRLLRALAGIPGVYVPALYAVAYHDDGTVRSIEPTDPAAPRIVAARTHDIARDLGSVRPVVPLIRTVQDRTVVEVRRGCVNGCRFCQAGVLTRPVRERPVEQVLEIVRQGLDNTGDDGVTLLSLSTADYTEIGRLVTAFREEFGPRRISISLPSLRISSFDVRLAAELSSGRKSGFTFAPEAGSDRLRRTINKPLDEAEFLDIVREAFRAGWRTLKMYFMIGLPGEVDEDLDGIVRIVRGALDAARQMHVKAVTLNVTLSPFVPKAHTPFQWAGQIPRDEMARRLNFVRDALRRERAVALKTSPLDSSVLEGVLARGDRRLGGAIERAWRAGCRFDAWRESFHADLWWEAMRAEGLDPVWYAERERGDDEVFPWDHLGLPAGRRFLEAERDRARTGEITPDCVNHPCAGCEACPVPPGHTLANQAPDAAEVAQAFQPAVARQAGKPAPLSESATVSGSPELFLAPSTDSPAASIGPTSPIGPITPIPSIDSTSPIVPIDPTPPASAPSPNKRPMPPRTEAGDPPPPVMRARLRFAKTGPLRFLAHLDLAELVHRILRRSGVPLAFSHGFNPQPRVMLSPPLPLGFEGRGELVDVLLLKRVDLLDWLRSLPALGPSLGLEWLGAEEVDLAAPSLQQAIERYDYSVHWRSWSPGGAPAGYGVYQVPVSHESHRSYTSHETNAADAKLGASPQAVAAPILPLDEAALQAGLDRFLAAETWPIEMIRKDKPQTRDARAFVIECATEAPPEGFQAAVHLAIRSENGTTLSPLAILGAIFGGDPAQGVVLHVARERLVVNGQE